MTETTCIRHFWNEHGVFVAYLLLSTLFLGAQMFQGLSFLDIGMYMSGYEHILSDPHPSVFLGQWLLSFTVTAWVMHHFGADSFIAMRVMFLVLTVVIQATVYIFYRKLLPRRFTIAALALTVLSLFGAYTEINYNDYTTLLFLIALLCYHRGLKSSLAYIALSGFITGVSFYFRITNVAFVAFPLAVWLTMRFVPWPRHRFLHQAAAFAAGWAVGMAVTYVLIVATGYGEIIDFTLDNIINVGGSSSDSHNLKSVFFCFYEIHKTEIAATSVILAVAFLMWLVFRHAPKGRCGAVVRCAMLAFLFGLTVFCIYFWEQPSSITVGLCLFGFALCMADSSVEPELKFVYALSLCLPLLAPAGSNAGAAFACKGTCVLSLPLALYIFDRQRLVPFAIRQGGAGLSAYRKALRLCYLSICAAMVYTNIYRPMMEDGNRLECRHTIDSPLTGPVMTTAENAATHNYLISKLTPLLPEGSYLISNGSLTAVSLLRCRPYAVFSTVFSSDAMNGRYLAYAFRHTNRLPYYLDDSLKRNSKDEHVLRWLHRIHAYKAVWTDGRYTLWKPVPKTAP